MALFYGAARLFFLFIDVEFWRRLLVSGEKILGWRDKIYWVGGVILVPGGRKEFI